MAKLQKPTVIGGNLGYPGVTRLTLVILG